MLSVAGRGNQNVQLMKSLESVAASVSVLVFFLVSPPAPAAAPTGNIEQPVAAWQRRRRVGRAPSTPAVPGTYDRRVLHRGNDGNVLQCRHRPQHQWYGTRTGSASNGAAGGNTSSLPPCPAHPPFNELCD